MIEPKAIDKDDDSTLDTKSPVISSPEPRWKLYTMYVFLLISAASSTIIAKLMQVRVELPNEVLGCCPGLICSEKSYSLTKFYHPMLMVSLMCIGQVLCLPFGYIVAHQPVP